MKKQLSLYTIAAMLAINTSSCSTVRIRTNAAQPATLVCKSCEGKLNRWFWGYVYNGEYLVNNCDSKALQAVQVKANFWQSVVTVVTLGVYCPVEVKWSCAKEQ